MCFYVLVVLFCQQLAAHTHRSTEKITPDLDRTREVRSGNSLQYASNANLNERQFLSAFNQKKESNYNVNQKFAITRL